MISKAEMQAQLEKLIAEIESAPSYKGDNFRYGLLVGKAIALGWAVKKLEGGGDLNVTGFTFDNWTSEQHVARREFPYSKRKPQ
jgi:hypothetical protein